MKNITTTFITRTRLLAFLTILALSSFAVAGPVTSDDLRGPNAILISWNLDFTSNTTADGTSTIAGAFSDEGTRHEDFTVTIKPNGEVIVSGTIVIHATQGDLTEQFTGRIPPGDDPITLIEGSGFFTGGTGAYAGLSGHATFEGTIDFATGKLVGVTEGNAHIHH